MRQSNHARMTAAAARLAGMNATLVLSAKIEQPEVQGNLLLDHLLDAEVRIVPSDTNMDAAMVEVADELRAAGERPYIIPVGGSNAVGTFGYVAATLELQEQLFAQGAGPSRLYYASGSRGTQSGLVLGAKLYHAPYRVCGIGVSPGDPEKRRRALAIANEAAELLGVATRVADEDLRNDDSQIGAGYGIPTEGCLEAIHLLARNEAVFLDPVYSGKAMAGLIADIRSGAIAPTETVIFLHTGGTPALFAQASLLFG
ncbi:MAG: pyridoxal-phosphate dependent enzyme [Chloroflexia bacterium]